MRTSEELLLLKLKENPVKYMRKRLVDGVYQYDFNISFYKNLDEVFTSFMCPGMCDPDCPLNVIHNTYEPFEDRHHMCNRKFYCNHPEAIPHILEEIGYEELTDDFISQLEKKINEDKKRREDKKEFEGLLQNYDKLEEYFNTLPLKLNQLSDFNLFLNAEVQKRWGRKNEQ